MQFFGKKSIRPLQELLPPDKGGVETAETVLAAAKRVSEQFGVKTGDDKIATAIAVAKNQRQTAEAFAIANIGILDSQQVLAHKTKRAEATWWERFKSWTWNSFGEILNFFDWHGGWSAAVAALFLLPIGVPFLIDTFFYEVSYFSSFWAILLPSIVLATIFDETEEVFEVIGVVTLSGLSWIPVTLFGFWFYHLQSNREWKSVPINDYTGVLSMSATLKIDQITSVLPSAKLELEVLESDTDDVSEFFITMPMGDNGDKLYLWHEAAYT
jgi:hypothetical protein